MTTREKKSRRKKKRTIIEKCVQELDQSRSSSSFRAVANFWNLKSPPVKNTSSRHEGAADCKLNNNNRRLHTGKIILIFVNYVVIRGIYFKLNNTDGLSNIPSGVFADARCNKSIYNGLRYNNNSSCEYLFFFWMIFTIVRWMFVSVTAIRIGLSISIVF